MICAYWRVEIWPWLVYPPNCYGAMHTRDTYYQNDFQRTLISDVIIYLKNQAIKNTRSSQNIEQKLLVKLSALINFIETTITLKLPATT